jgi:hypothetical protein
MGCVLRVALLPMQTSLKTLTALFILKNVDFFTQRLADGVGEAKGSNAYVNLKSHAVSRSPHGLCPFFFSPFQPNNRDYEIDSNRPRFGHLAFRRGRSLDPLGCS